MRTTKILHVDDDPDIRDLTRLSLELDQGFVVETASSGAMALDCMAATKPDLVLLDVMMPGMSGPELLQQMRDQPDMADIPVVFMTAVADQSVLDDLLGLEVLGIISKPFDAIALADDLTSIVQDDLAQAS